MSEEQLKAFLDGVDADAGLQEKLKLAEDADVVTKVAKEAGFLMSVDEYKLAHSQLSHKELEDVYGRTIVPTQGFACTC